MRGRIVPVDPAAEHGDRHPAGVECAAVRLAVDPACHPADDHEPGRGELAPERPRDDAAVRGARARTDDRDRRSCEQLRRRLARAARARSVGPGSPAAAAGTTARHDGSGESSCRAHSDRRPVRERLGEMLRQHRVGARERRDGAGHPCHTCPPAAREGHALDGAVEQRRCRLGSPKHIAVAQSLPGRDDARPHRRRRLPRRRRQLLRLAAAASRRRGRSGRAARATPSPGRRRSAAGCSRSRQPVAPATARAQVHRRDETKPGREERVPADPGDRDDTVLERLPQRLEHRPRELRQLVEQEDAAVREARLAGARHGTAADDRRRRGSVMRGAERRRRA